MFICISKDGYLFYFFSLQPSATLLCCSNASGIGHCSCWLVRHFDIHPSVWRFFVLFCFCFSPSLLFGIKSCSRFIFYSLCPSTGMNHFAKDPWFLMLENGTGNQDVSARCKHYFFHISPTTLYTLWRQEPYSSLSSVPTDCLTGLMFSYFWTKL